MPSTSATRPAPLFTRYCPACNTTQAVAARVGTGLQCAACKGELRTFDAHALIPALGAKLSQGDREVAIAALRSLDKP